MSHQGTRNWVTHIYISNGDGIVEDRLVLRFIAIPAFLKLFLCVTHARRYMYVVSSQLWFTIVSCRVASSVRRNKT